MTEKREEGISYFYVFPDANGDVEQPTKNGPVFVGRKRYAGLYCRACETALGFKTEKAGVKLNKQMRSADKTDNNIIEQCPTCSGTSPQTVVPCCSFDWQVPPHKLREFSKAPLSGKKSAQSTPAHTDGSDDDEDDVANGKSISEQQKTYKQALTHIKQQESGTSSRSAPPSLERGGLIETQYGTRYSLEDFWHSVVDPCHVQHYDQILKDHLA